MCSRFKILIFTLTIFSAFTNVVYSGEINEDRARQNYILNCQGCHLHDGSGFPDNIPNMKDFVGNFLRIEGGREFIVQVPGAANAPLEDEELAEVMNWLLVNFSAEQLPNDYRPYTAKEVAELRRTVLIDVNRIRESLIQKMEKELKL